MMHAARAEKNNHGQMIANVFALCAPGTSPLANCFGWVLSAGLLLAMVSSVSPAMGQDVPAAANPVTQVASNELASSRLTSQAKDAIRAEVRQQLSDPESARFRWLEKKTDGNVYCGFVNSKNRMGGYVGFVPFQVILFKGKNGVVASFLTMADGDPKSIKSKVTVKTCQDNGNNLSDPTTEDTSTE
jgi:hypothetical protein